jgi:hypothetical protein
MLKTGVKICKENINSKSEKNTDNEDIDFGDFIYNPNDKTVYAQKIFLGYPGFENIHIKLGEIIENPIIYKNAIDYLFRYHNYESEKNYLNFLIRFFDLAFGLDDFNEDKLNKIIKYQDIAIISEYNFKFIINRYNCLIKVAYQINKTLPNSCINEAFNNFNWDLLYFFLKNDLKINIELSTNKLEKLFLCPQTKPKYHYEKKTNYDCNIDIKIIDFIVKNKIAITQKCFYNLIEANKIINTDIDINYKTLFENKYCCDVSNIINLMYNYGFAITQDHFKTLIKNRLYIDNYKKYKLEITKEIEDACNEVLYYPYKEIKVMDSGYKKMLKYNINLSELKKIQQKYNLKNNYNVNDLEMACSRENVDLKSVAYLMNECKIQPNFKCVSNLLKRDKVSKRSITCANIILDKLKEMYEK